MALLLPPYDTGVATVAHNGTSITVTGLLGPSNAREGDLFVQTATGLGVLIRDVPDTTHITIDPWPGSALSSAAYRIEKTSPLRYAWGTALADVQRMLDTLNGKVFVIVEGDEPDPYLGEEDQLALKINSGQWLAWRKTGGVWVPESSPAGLFYRGEWNSGTSFVTNDRVSENGTSYIAKQSNTNQRPSLDTGHVYWDTAGVKGDIGNTGTAATVAVGTVTTGTAGSSASVTNSGSSTAATLNFTIPRGDKGNAGDAATVGVGSVSTGAPGSSASVTNVGTSGAATLNFSIPKGDVGPQGAAASVAAGTVTTLPAGSSATVTNLGTSSAATFAFGIPRGDTGVQGIQGERGAGLEPNATGSFLDRATYDGQTKGFRFLQTDVSPFVLFVKASNTSGDWSPGTYIGGTIPIGDLGHATDSLTQTYDMGHAA